MQLKANRNKSDDLFEKAINYIFSVCNKVQKSTILEILLEEIPEKLRK